MKFIHIADVHLGQNRTQEARTVKAEKGDMEQLGDTIAVCEQKKDGMLLIAGDLFHRQPLLRELKK